MVFHLVKSKLRLSNRLFRIFVLICALFLCYRLLYRNGSLNLDNLDDDYDRRRFHSVPSPSIVDDDSDETDPIADSNTTADIEESNGKTVEKQVETSDIDVKHENKIPVLVIACNRPSVARCIDSLIKYRPSAAKFPIVVSHDCGHEETANVIKSYSSQAVTYIEQPDKSIPATPPQHKEYVAYYQIARHYKWAINHVLNEFKFGQVIIVEDDMEVAPDFFDYFEAFLPVLRSDKSLFCVSAWNDNGKQGMASDSQLFYRSSFFPGLGWMLMRDFWIEVEKKWPRTYWDDWLRHPEQRKNRACIRPEISRTFNFGKKGVSGGLYYDEHIGKVFLNTEKAEFSGYDRSSLTVWDRNQDALPTDVNYKLPTKNYETIDIRRFIKQSYDEFFLHQVYSLSSKTSTLALKQLVESNALDTFDIYTNNANIMGILDSRITGTSSLTVFDDVNSIRFCGKKCRRRYLITFRKNDYYGDYKAALAEQADILKDWNLMNDLREDVARTAYIDIVSFKVRLKYPPELLPQRYGAKDKEREEYIMVYVAPETKPSANQN